MIIRNNGQNRSMVLYESYVDKIDKAYTKLTHEEKKIVDIILRDMVFPNHNSVDRISEMMGIAYAMEYKRVPVSPEDFFNSEYYLGEAVHDLYPEIRKDLISFTKGDYTEAIVTGGLGWGKSYWTSYAIMRLVYELSCFKNPSASLGVASGAKLTIAMLSVNEKQAREVMFSEIGTKVASSIYFRDEFKFRITKKEMTFGNAKKGEPVIYLVPRANTDNSVIGLTVIAAIVDEINFIQTTKKAQYAAKQRGVKTLTKQEQLYGILKKRIASRFMSNGKQLGKIFLASSKLTKSDFTAQRINSSLYDEQIFVRDYANWQTKAEAKHSKNSFFVMVGNAGYKSKILKAKDIENLNIPKLLENDVEIIQVPKDFYEVFSNDIEGAIADIAGRVSTASVKFFKNLEAIEKSFTKRLPVPYRRIDRVVIKKDNILKTININTSEEQTIKPTQRVYLYEESYISNSGKNKPDFRNLCESFKHSDGSFYWKPKVNPGATRFIHIDGSRNQDSTGIAMGHIVKTIFRKMEDSDLYEELPVIIIDLAIAIEPPISDGGEIDYREIRDFVIALRDVFGFPINLITMDGVERTTNLQLFNQMGFNTNYVSVDRTAVPYNILKTTMKEGRLAIHLSNILKEELSQLVEDPLTGKIDHPQGSSKDVADAVCGVVYSLYTHLVLENHKDVNHKKNFYIKNNNVSMASLMTEVYSELKNQKYFQQDVEREEAQFDLEKMLEGDKESLEIISKLTLKEKEKLIDKINGDYFPEYEPEVELDITVTPFDLN